MGHYLVSFVDPWFVTVSAE